MDDMYIMSSKSLSL